MIIQAIPGTSTPLETIFLQNFLERSFLVKDSINKKKELVDLKRIEIDN